MSSAAAIIYKTKCQRAVAFLSSTEAEFVSAADTGGKQFLLYVRSILHNLGLALDGVPTNLLVDKNKGAIFMVQAQAPPKRTQHVDIKYFALLRFSESQQLRAIPIKTDHNISNSTTKPTGLIKVRQHADLYMGRIPLTFATIPHPRLLPAYWSTCMRSPAPPLRLFLLSHTHQTGFFSILRWP